MKQPFFIKKTNLTKQVSFAALLLALLLCCLPTTTFAQQKKSLEKKRAALIKEIKMTASLLDETRKIQSTEYSRFVTLQNQIKKREQLINTLEQELEYSTSSIDRASEVVEALQVDIARLKSEYGEMVRKAYRQKANNSNLAFLLSSKSVNTAMARYVYLKQYDQYRQKQSALIAETQNTLSDKIVSLEARKVEKEELIETSRQQSLLMQAELEAKDELLASLRQDESKLQVDLKQKKRAHEKLNVKIEDIIRKDNKARRKKGKKGEATKPGTKALDNANATLSSDFARNKRQLPWPVKNGVVTGYFGIHNHPTLSQVKISNNGIDIRTDKNAAVRSVFDGKVVAVQYIDTDNHYLVIVNHGEYYTAYSNVGKVIVKRGQQVDTREQIGTVARNKTTNISELHFEVWQNKLKMNPLNWVARK